MKLLRFLIFIIVAAFGVAHGQTARLVDFPTLSAAPASNDWIYGWDTSAGFSVKISPANLMSGRQPIDPDLTEIAALAPSGANRFLVYENGTGWVVANFGAGLNYDSGTDTISATATGGGWVYEGAWATATAYQAGDVVTNVGGSSACTSGHTSGKSTAPGVGASPGTVWGVLSRGGAGTGAVTAAAPFGTDNRALRSDGTGKGSQASLVEITDTGDINTPGDLTVNSTTTDSLTVTTVTNAFTQAALDAISTTRGTILYRNAADWVALAPDSGKYLQSQGAGSDPIWATVAGGSSTGSFGVTVDGGGSVLTAGSKGYVYIPFACTITGWSLVADQAGSVAFDVEKAADGTIPSASIVASAAPALSSDQIERSTTLTGWTTSVTANDVIEFEITGTPATITRATLQIHYTK